MSNEKTTIEVSVDNYKKLSGRKNPGDSFDDVIGRVLTQNEELQERLEENKENYSSEPGSRTTESQTESGGSSINVETTDSASSGENKSGRQMVLSSDNRLEDDVEQAILELDLSTNASQESWIPAVRESYRYLKEEGQASKQDFINNVFPEEPAKYDKEQTWWRKVVRPGLSDLPKVEKPRPGGHWEFTKEQN